MKQLSDILQRDRIATDTGWIDTVNPVKYIRVTRKDLKGDYLSCLDCPIARACKRFFNEDIMVSARKVHLKDIIYRFSDKDSWKAFRRSKSKLLRYILRGFTIELTPIN